MCYKSSHLSVVKLILTVEFDRSAITLSVHKLIVIADTSTLTTSPMISRSECDWGSARLNMRLGLFSSCTCAYHPLTSLQVPGYPPSRTPSLFLWRHDCIPILPDMVQIYCGGVNTTPSIDRWTHTVCSIYRQLDSPARARNNVPLFLLLSCTSMSA